PGIARHLVATHTVDTDRAAELRCPRLAALRRQSVLHRFSEAVLSGSTMALTRPTQWICAAAAALVLAACGGGGSPGDVHPGTDPAIVPGEPNAFLVFPNPQVQPDGSLQTTSAVYAQAYYAAIDPQNAKDTLAKWKAANGFDTGTGTQVTVIFGDVRDLGFGRRITGRQNID